MSLQHQTKNLVSLSKSNFSSTEPPQRLVSARTILNSSVPAITSSDSPFQFVVTMVKLKTSLVTVLNTSITNFQSKEAQDTMLESIFKKLWLLHHLWLSSSQSLMYLSVVPKEESKSTQETTLSVKLRRSPEDTLWNSLKRVSSGHKLTVLVPILELTNRLWLGSKILMSACMVRLTSTLKAALLVSSHHKVVSTVVLKVPDSVFTTASSSF